jgi:hypothetical protein
MGVFDYLSSLWDQKDKPDETVSQPAPSKSQAARAPAPPAAPPPTAKKDAKSAQAPAKPKTQTSPPPQPKPAQAVAKPAPTPPPPPAVTLAPSKPPAPAPELAPDPEVVTAASAAVSAAVSAAERDRLAAEMAELAPQEVDRALDEAFGEGASRNVTHVSAIAKELDEASVRELFGGIAANHARPIKNFIFELKRGTATKDWIEVCRPVMATLIEGAHSMELREAARAMTEFDEALSLVHGEGAGSAIEDSARELLLSSFDEMATALPEAFLSGDDERRRDTIIIHALLKQVSDVGHVTFERLYGAGLTSLEALFLANGGDLAATTGIPLWLCDRIVERIGEHRKDLERAQRDSGLGERREHLRKLIEELRERHDRFERAVSEESADPSRGEAKREYRQERMKYALQIEVVLAEMGELDLVEQIQKLPFSRRIERLTEFIQNSANVVPAGVLASAGAATPAARPAER